MSEGETIFAQAVFIVKIYASIVRFGKDHFIIYYNIDKINNMK